MASAYVWQWAEDYIYAGNRLIAAETPAGIRHFLVDHLGTPRTISWSQMRSATRLGTEQRGSRT
jgi:hypothetical protein